MSKCKSCQLRTVASSREGYDELRCDKCGYIWFIESLSVIAEESHRLEFAIPCCCCGKPAGERHLDGCLVLVANKDRHGVRPDLFDSDGNAIPASDDPMVMVRPNDFKSA